MGISVKSVPFTNFTNFSFRDLQYKCSLRLAHYVFSVMLSSILATSYGGVMNAGGVPYAVSNPSGSVANWTGGAFPPSLRW